jgi:hypothetical protein
MDDATDVQYLPDALCRTSSGAFVWRSFDYVLVKSLMRPVVLYG